jgi:hypothetical protein
MSGGPRTTDRPGRAGTVPRRLRLPGFIGDEDEIGLGDVIKKATSIVGIKPCGGCADRARRLNNLMVFSRRR